MDISSPRTRVHHWKSPKPGSQTPFPATIVGSRRRIGQKSPPAGRRRRPVRATPRCGAKRPMGCTSSAVTTAARSSVLRRWRVPQPKDGRSCAEATRTTCISLTARPPRGQRSVCRRNSYFLLGSCNCHLGSYFLWTLLALRLRNLGNMVLCSYNLGFRSECILDRAVGLMLSRV